MEKNRVTFLNSFANFVETERFFILADVDIGKEVAYAMLASEDI